MQALFSAYATAVKKPMEEDSGGEKNLWFKLHDADTFSRFRCPSNRTRTEDRTSESRHCSE